MRRYTLVKRSKAFTAAGNNMVSKSASTLANRSIHEGLRRGGTICKFVDQFVLFFLITSERIRGHLRDTPHDVVVTYEQHFYLYIPMHRLEFHHRKTVYTDQCLLSETVFAWHRTLPVSSLLVTKMNYCPIRRDCIYMPRGLARELSYVFMIFEVIGRHHCLNALVKGIKRLGIFEYVNRLILWQISEKEEVEIVRELTKSLGSSWTMAYTTSAGRHDWKSSFARPVFLIADPLMCHARTPTFIRPSLIPLASDRQHNKITKTRYSYRFSFRCVQLLSYEGARHSVR